MRAAPAVRAPLAAGGPEHMLIALLYAITAIGLMAWGAGHAGLAWSLPGLLAGLALALLAGGGGAWWARRALPADGDHLQWDGQRWTLALRSAPGGLPGPAETPLLQVELALDLGAWLLLRLQLANGQQRWQVARASVAGTAWHGLRVALRAHAGMRPVA